MKVVRGEGRRAAPATAVHDDPQLPQLLLPGTAHLGQRVTSLREITRDDIQAALDDRPGVTARNLLPALRSLFRALKQERIIFRDPTRGITLPAMRRLPVPIPTDQLRGLIDRAGSPMAKLTVALIAIHGLGKKETTLLLLDDLDLPRGQLVVRRPTGPHTVYLDELTRTLADQLAPRTPPPLAPHRQPPPAGQPGRPPLTPHCPPIAHTVIDAIFSAARPHPVQSCARTGSWTRPGTPPTPSTSCASSASPPTPP